MSASGTSRQFAATQHFGRFRSEADIGLNRAYRKWIYEYTSSVSHRDRVALWQRHAGAATQREQPRAPCAIRPPRPEASVASIDRIAFDPHQPGPDCRISNWQWSSAGIRNAARSTPAWRRYFA